MFDEFVSSYAPASDSLEFCYNKLPPPDVDCFRTIF